MRAAFAVLALLVSCNGKDSPSKDGPPTEPGECVDTWESWAHGFMRTWCTSCHSSELPEGLRYDAPVGIDFDTYASTVQLAALIEREATGNDPAMPPVGGPPDADRQRLADWIACGTPGAGTGAPSVCDEPLSLTTSDVTVGSAGEASDLCAGATGVDGDLVIRGPADLSCLCEVRGDLVIEAGASEVDLPNLATVGGSVVVEGAELAEVRFPRLSAVAGDVRLAQLSEAELVDVSSLQTVGGSLVLEDIPKLEVLLEDATALKSVGGDLVLDDLDAWYGFHAFARLESIGGTLRVHENDVITVVHGFEALQEVASIDIQGNAALEEILGFDVIETIPGDVIVFEHLKLETEDAFDSLTSVGGTLHLGAAPLLASVGGLRDISSAGGLVIEGTGLNSVGTWSVQTIDGDLDISLNPLLDDVTGLHGVTSVGGDVRIANNPALGAASAQALADAIESIGGTTTLSGNGP